ncbi:MAG: EutN/CcmL family microcompartment protein [Lachnospiraceae bacterium]|nr:EutN/CcmL family microcompartment protein [Lachnospiraceae bacterium]
MILGTVVGTVVSTRKMEKLVGYKLLMVEPYFGDKEKIIVAGDNIGAGIGEMVLVTTDETTQHGLDHDAPIDAFIVGIVDTTPVIGK